MLRQLAIFSFVSAILIFPLACSEEKQTEEEFTAKVEALIEKLALPESTAKLSREEQEANEGKIIKSWKDLRDLGPRAFPTVIKHLADKRISYTADAGSDDRTWTVGLACFDVIRCNVEPFNGIVHSSSIPDKEFWWRPTYCREFLSTPEKAREWIEKRREKTLVDLQIEALEWVASNHSGREVEVTQKDRQYLLDLLAQLKRQREPLKPSVPWAM